MKDQKHSFIIKEKDLNIRLDKLLVKHFPDHTRRYFQKLIVARYVLVNGKKAKAGLKLQDADLVTINPPALKKLQLEAKNIPLNIIHEDKNLLIINKPAGMVVHPGTHGSHIDDSLVNAILYHCENKLGGIGNVVRPGIVHRLDKDTSGVLIVAKNDITHKALSDQFKARTVEKNYLALLCGHLKPQTGLIEAPIGRHAIDRKKMSVSYQKSGKIAITRYKVLRYPNDFTLVEIQLLTGRTHQIRVHFAAIGFPVVGDKTYGNEKINRLAQGRYGLNRQFLHAGTISFILPDTQKKTIFKAPLSADLETVLRQLESGQKRNAR